jgi:hypothetical protein
LEGRAVLDGHEIRRPVIPAEEMTQAFIYQHLVPVHDLLVASPGRWPARAPLRLSGQQPIKLAEGGTARVRVLVPQAPRYRSFAQQLQLELSKPPEGITIQQMSANVDGLAITIAAEAGKVEDGLQGNLIVDAFLERTFPARGASGPGVKRKIPLGTLPAIPFEIDIPVP